MDNVLKDHKLLPNLFLSPRRPILNHQPPGFAFCFLATGH
jgi:hypothetical protein